MSSLTIDHLILDRGAYSAVRAPARKQMLEVRRNRRVHIGAQVCLEFENEQTLHYQVQEMIYAEGIQTEAGAGEEIDTYRRLLPTAGSVSATAFLQFDDVDTVRHDLEGLAGIQHTIYLQLGEERVVGVDVPPPDEADGEQTYSVHFVRFDVTGGQRAALANLAVAVQLGVDHPNYQSSVPMPAELRAQLVADLAQAAAAAA